MERVYYVHKDDVITLFVGGEIREVENTEENRETFIPLAEDNKAEEILELTDMESEATRAVLDADERFVRDPSSGRIYLAGTDRPVPRNLADRIQQAIDEGYPVESEINFWKNCLLNPEPGSVEQLWNFTQQHDIPVTDEGLILAYKKVETQEYYDPNTGEQAGYATKEGNLYTDEDGNPIGRQYDVLTGKMQELALSDELMFVDIYSGEFNNSVGQVVSMPREECEHNPAKACAPGLHAAAMEYIPHYGTNGNISPPDGETWEDSSLPEIHQYLKDYSGDPIVEVLINPRHVVSVPADHDFAKLRCCQYFVFSLFNGERTEEYVPQDYIDRDSENLREDLEADIEEAKAQVEQAERQAEMAGHLL